MSEFVNAASLRKNRLIRWTARVFLALLALYTLLLAAVYIFLQRDPASLAKSWLAPIQERTGLNFDIGSIDVTLLPLPAMSIGDLVITGKNLEFTAAYVSARPSFARIFLGDFFPGVINVLRPRMKLTLDFPLDESGAAADKIRALAENSGSKAALPANLDIDLSQFNAEIAGAENTKIILAGLQCRLELRRGGEISGEASLSSLRLFRDGDALASLENFRAKGETSFRNFLTDTSGLHVDGLARIRNVLRDARFGLEFESSSSGWNGRGSISAVLAAGSIPCSLLGRVTALSNGGEIVVRGLDWQLGPDSGSIDLTAQLGEKLSDARISGTFLANRVSLTQWLGFARNLCPGLQISLDNITRARIEFELDKIGLKARKIEATCQGSTFRGKGGVPDWRKPVVELNLRAPVANLGAGLPESLAETPDAPWFPNPPLTPLPNEPLKPGENGIGYDIRLSAGETIYGKTRIQNGALRIYPGKLDKSGLRDVLLEARGKFYGSSVIGSCILGADPSLPIYITMKATKIDGAPLARALSVLPFRQGVFDASATVTSRGKKLDLFLANLKGNMNAKGRNVVFTAAGPREVFTSVTASANLKKASWDGKRLTFDGKWRAALTSKDIDASCQATGPLNFGVGGLAFKNLQGSLDARCGVSPLPENTRLKLNGVFSGTPDQDRFELAKGKLEIFGQTIRCDATFDAGKKSPSAQGKLSAEIKSVNALAARFGIKNSRIPAAFNDIKLSANFSASQDVFRLEKIAAKLGASSIGGNLRAQMKEKRPQIISDLTMDRLDLSLLHDQKKAATSWKFNELTTFDAEGKLAIKDMIVYDMRFLNSRITYKLHNGKLAANPITANFYGAPIRATLNANFQKGFSFDSHINAGGFNLGEAAKARKIEALLSGQASMDAKVNASLAGNAKLAGALNGQWSFNVANGSWQAVEKGGKPKGKPTKFRMISASGTISRGLVKSDNFKLNGYDLNVSGGGWLNLASQEVNCNFNVDMKGMPDFPLRLYGPLANTKTSIGAGKLVINAMGEVVSGFAGAVGGVLKGAWNIFSK